MIPDIVQRCQRYQSLQHLYFLLKSSQSGLFHGILPQRVKAVLPVHCRFRKIFSPKKTGRTIQYSEIISPVLCARGQSKISQHILPDKMLRKLLHSRIFVTAYPGFPQSQLYSPHPGVGPCKHSDLFRPAAGSDILPDHICKILPLFFLVPCADSLYYSRLAMKRAGRFIESYPIMADQFSGMINDPAFAAVIDIQHHL